MSKKKSTPEPRARRSAPREDVAVLLARTFSHPDLPRVIWEHIADSLCEMDCSFDKYANPEVMREVIRGAPTVRARRGGGR